MKHEPEQLEANLSKALAALPNVPVASNFTARVMQAVEQEESRPVRRWGWNWHGLLPRVAVGMTAMFLAVVAVQHHEVNARRDALARSVALVANGQPGPSVEALKNFDTIQRLSQPQHADEELLALLQ